MPEPAGDGGTRIGGAGGTTAPGETVCEGCADSGVARTLEDPPARVISSKTEGGGRSPRAPAARLWPLLALGLALLLLPAFRKPWKQLPLPRNAAQITRIMASGPHGDDCASCHTQHAGDEPVAREHALIGPNDNTLCDDCHLAPWAGGSYGGTRLYDGSAHGSSPSTVWPGPYPPARAEANAARAGVALRLRGPHSRSSIPCAAQASRKSLVCGGRTSKP